MTITTEANVRKESPLCADGSVWHPVVSVDGGDFRCKALGCKFTLPFAEFGRTVRGGT